VGETDNGRRAEVGTASLRSGLEHEEKEEEDEESMALVFDDMTDIVSEVWLLCLAKRKQVLIGEDVEMIKDDY